MKYEQPFENMEGKTAYVIGHALEILYFDEIKNEWVMESRSYTDDFTKNWYRWIFDGELPKVISDLIPSDALSKAKTDLLMIKSRTNDRITTYGGNCSFKTI